MPPVTISSCYDLSDNCFSFTSMLVDAMRSMDMSCSPDSLTSYSCFPYHVPLARVLVRFLFCFTCFLYLYEYGLTTRLRLLVCSSFLLLSCRLVYAYLYCLCLSFCSLSTHLTTRYFWTYDSLVYLRLVCLLCMFVLVSHRPLYIWLGMGTRSPSSIYFATTLQV